MQTWAEPGIKFPEKNFEPYQHIQRIYWVVLQVENKSKVISLDVMIFPQYWKRCELYYHYKSYVLTVFNAWTV